MKILISNDDGIHSPGIRALQKALQEDHEIWLVAPDGDRSGFGQSITFRDPIRMQCHGKRVYSCSGTPADCVLYSLGGFLKEAFDLVLTGINVGPNLGSDILYSGTVGAARQGAYRGIPAIALSASRSQPPFNFDEIASYVALNLEALKDLWEEGTVVNVNFPENLGPETRTLWANLSWRYYTDTIHSKILCDDETLCTIQGFVIESKGEEGSDTRVVGNGNIAISLVATMPALRRETDIGRDVL